MAEQTGTDEAQPIELLWGQARARLWFGDLPAAGFKMQVPLQIVFRASSGPGASLDARKVALEVDLPLHVSSYGLLGASFEPAESGRLLTVVGSGAGGRYHSRSWGDEPIEAGLDPHYLPSVVLGISETLAAADEIPMGELTYGVAAQSGVRSSPMLFRSLARTVTRVLLENTPADHVEAVFTDERARVRASYREGE